MAHLNLPSGTPRQQTENKALWNEARTPGAAHFFTAGYSGRSLNDLIAQLIANGVRTLVDIRYNPVSMYRPELSKANLQKAIEKRGIVYVHLPELGVPRYVRALAAERGTRDVIWDWYDENIIMPYFPGRNLHQFFNSLEHPVTLMCVEVDPNECHRHRLFVALEEMGLRGFDL